jgi:SAM-dependent methyltransferase
VQAACRPQDMCEVPLRHDPMVRRVHASFAGTLPNSGRMGSATDGQSASLGRGLRLTTAGRVAAQGFRDPRLRPWDHSPLRPWLGAMARGHQVGCNICGWHGNSFDGVAHSESAVCLRCGSIARDRYLYHCWTTRSRYRRGLGVLETSPRLGSEYRSHMADLVHYVASDYDDRAHRGDRQLDLQDLDLPDASLDVVLTSHVLEHVPDTGLALTNLRRVVAPDGVVFVMVPLLQAHTAPPGEVEYHGDQTLVYWRFGWDFAELAAQAGFATTTLVTSDLKRRALENDPWGHGEAGVGRDSVLEGARERVGSLTVVADEATSAWYGFFPSFFFVVWECRPGRVGAATPPRG